jgi:hypothetical protein
MADYGPYAPAQFDFSQLDPVGAYQRGAKIARENRARQDLAKCAPDDFACMTKVLSALDPELGVKSAMLQNTLKHQAFQEDLATQQLGLQQETNRILGAARLSRAQIGEQKATAPFNAARAAAAGYPEARTSLLSSGAKGFGESLTGGASIGAVHELAASVAAARGLTGKAAETYIDNVVPGKADFILGRAQEKLQRLEHDYNSLGPSAEQIGAGSATDYSIPEYAPPVAAPPAAAAPPPAAPAAPVPRSVKTVTVRPDGSFAPPEAPAPAMPPPVTVSPPGPPVAPAAPAAPAPPAPPGLGGGEAVQAAPPRAQIPPPQARVPDKLYILPNGTPAYWRVLPNGQSGWEPAESGANQ